VNSFDFSAGTEFEPPPGGFVQPTHPLDEVSYRLQGACMSAPTRLVVIGDHSWDPVSDPSLQLL